MPVIDTHADPYFAPGDTTPNRWFRAGQYRAPMLPRAQLRSIFRVRGRRADREEFVVEGCYLMRNRFRAQEVWERLRFDVAECLEFTEQSPVQQEFRTLLFSRIVPCVKDIGLWGPKVRRAYADLGVLDAAKADLEALMRDDGEIAERMKAEHAAAITEGTVG